MKTAPYLFVILVSAAASAFNAAAANLSGSLTDGPQNNVNLTATGTEDWAIWGYALGGTSTSLTPDVSMAGGSGISALTFLNPHAQPLRGLGQFAINFSFSWTNGNTTLSAANARGGLQCNDGSGPGLGVGEGFSFVVPADTTEREVTVYVDEHLGVGQLTATLSDGSAPAYVNSSIPEGDNSPGRYTIDYAAASAGQTLTLQWSEISAAADYDNPAIYAVTLSAVPEPGTAALAGVGAVCLLVWRRRLKAKD